MQVSPVNQQTFTGKIGENTLKRFIEGTKPFEFKMIEKYRVGGRNTLIDVVILDKEPKRLPTGPMVRDQETFAMIKNSRRKNEPPVLIKLADGALPFDMKTFRMITASLVAKGEKLLENMRTK